MSIKSDRWIRRMAAEQGYAKARTYLGDMYRTGLGVTQDYSEALRLYHLAADQGHPRAKNNIGDMNDEGLGTDEDPAEALRWYRLSA